MIGPLRPGETYDAFADGFLLGLVGAIGVTLVDADDNEIMARTTANIIQVVPVGDFARYRYQGVAPETEGTYLLVWDDADGNSTSEELDVSYSAVAPSATPCQEWITGDDVAECCSSATVGTYTSLLDTVAAVASQVLYELTGRRFSGECGPVTVRPCATECSCFDDWHSWGQIPWNGVTGWGWDAGRGLWNCGGRSCGCQPLSEVVLAGYPIRTVAVKIDGALLPTTAYRLDYSRVLVRLRDTDAPDTRLVWPACQILDLPDTEPGTWSVTYTYGEDPPAAAIEAAKQLACELYKGCQDESCALPGNVTRVVRQGISQERITPLADALRAGKTGLVLVDAFIAAYGNVPSIRPALWGPDAQQFPRPLG